MDNQSELLSAEQTAQITGLSQSTLAKMRLRGDGPPYIKLGPRRVAYSTRDLNSWLDARRFNSTSQQSQHDLAG